MVDAVGYPLGRRSAPISPLTLLNAHQPNKWPPPDRFTSLSTPDSVRPDPLPRTQRHFCAGLSLVR
jgi:hypothetical protein